MATATLDSRQKLIEEMNRLRWVHSIHLGDGIVTPGEWGNHNPVLWDVIRGMDFRGKKVLDIGCWDGLWSFEAEKRGAAEVYATDLITQRTFQHPTFELAAQALDSKVKHFPRTSVYDVEQLGVNDFDVVLFAGVYYHLKEPLLALSTLRRVMKEGAIILVEGAILDLEGTANPDDCYARFYYRDQFCGDDSNWWVPTTACLRQWVECNFFEIESEAIWRPGNENVRGHIIARAVSRKDSRYIREEDALRPFDQNEY